MFQKIWRRISSILFWLRHQDLLVLLAALAIVIGVWAFVAVADAVREGETQSFDEWLLRALRDPADVRKPLGPAWLGEVARDLTSLGGVAVLSLVTAAVAGFLGISGRYSAMVFVLSAALGGFLLSTVLKASFDRERPQVVPHLSDVYTSSFPSGHSMLSATVYLSLGALLTRFVQKRLLKIYFIIVALLLTGLTGISRVYMGVHYPTDVLAGWSAGLVWAVLCWLVARWLQSRQAVGRHVE
jgi:undecaprenyl-diphosphatase